MLSRTNGMILPDDRFLLDCAPAYRAADSFGPSRFGGVKLPWQIGHYPLVLPKVSYTCRSEYRRPTMLCSVSIAQTLFENRELVSRFLLKK